MKNNQTAIKAAIIANLPCNVRWMVNDTPVDFDFSYAHEELCTLPDWALDASNPDIAMLRIIGHQDVAEGGGACPWLCVHIDDGSVWGFDCEAKKPMFLLNSSLPRFIASFRLLNEYLVTSRKLPPEIENCLQHIDPEAYHRSDWRLLIDGINA